MKDIIRIKSLLTTLFMDLYFAVLATRSKEQLHTSLVAFYLCTPRATRKYGNLTQYPSVSLLVHNSANLAADIGQSVAVTVTGRATEAAGSGLEHARAVYLAKNPHMAAFASSPETALIAVNVIRYDVVEHFQNVTILDIHGDRIVSNGD
jgi:hypothetical protein